MRKVYHTLVGGAVLATVIYGSALQAQTFMQANPFREQIAFNTSKPEAGPPALGPESDSPSKITAFSTQRIAPPNTVPVAKCKNIVLELLEGCELMVDAAAFDDGSYDADGDVLEFSVSPEGPYPVGTTFVTFRSDDGKMSNQCTASITVQDKIAPVVVVNNLTLALNAQGTVALTANDVDAGSTDNCSIATKVLSKTEFTCAELGENSVSLTLTDSQGNQTTAEAIITVVDLEAPVIAETYEFDIDENLASGSLVGQLIADDNCGEIGYFIKSGNANGAFTIDYAGRLKVQNSASLDFETTQEFNLTVEAADNSDNVAISQVLVRLNNLNDHTPEVANPIEAQQVLEDDLFSFNIPADAFKDADVDDDLFISAHDLPEWLQFQTETQALQGIPLNEHVGTFTIKLRATDNAGQYVEHSIRLRVINTNDAPQSGEMLAQQEILEDEAYTFTIPAAAFADVDADDLLTFTTGPLPAWLTFNAQTATFHGIPLNEHVGQHPISVRATDLEGLFAEQRYTITVFNTNDAPHAILLSNDLLDENKPAGSLIGSLSSQDTDTGDKHTYSLIAGEGDTDNALFVLEGDALSTAQVLNFEEKEFYSLRIRSQDGAGAALEEIFIITLIDVEDSKAFLPNLFTPNGDGSNDHFILRAYGVGQLNFRIYNKQGRLVYQTSNVVEATEMGWDGKSKGTPQPEGPYVWQLEGRYKDGSPLTIEGKTFGNLVLIR